jgi:hypothetical protein
MAAFAGIFAAYQGRFWYTASTHHAEEVYAMGMREKLSSVGFVPVLAGAAIILALAVGACGTNGGTGMQPLSSPGGQTAARPQLPSMDINAPTAFQTAAFAYG